MNLLPRWLLAAILAGPCAGLAACARYGPLPLPAKPDLAGSLIGLRHGGVSFDAPLSVSEVAVLAVQNNPDLRAVRAQHGVAQAQLLQAGLLPNPQATGAILPLVAGLGTTTAWNAGLSEDIRSLITLSTRRRSARESAKQIDAQILWQEWQVIGQARLLAVDLIEGERSLRLFVEARDLLAARAERSRRALAAGNATVAATTPDIVALQAARVQVDDLQRLQLSRRHQLNALLGLAPNVAVPLNATPDLPSFATGTVERLLPTLTERRPDLVALRFGYAAEDAKLRTAIVSQFPNLAFGVTGGSDNSNIRNIGPQISPELPIFNQNQGNIAIERATRQQLHDEYQARLDAAYGAAARLLTELQQLEEQYRASTAGTDQLRATVRTVDQAYQAGNFDERSYVDLRGSLLAKEIEAVKLEQVLLEQRVILRTLIGSNLPVSLGNDLTKGS